MNAIVTTRQIIDVSNYLECFDLDEQTFQVCFEEVTAKVTYTIDSDCEGRDFYIESVELFDEENQKIDRDVTDFEWDVIKACMREVESEVIADEADAAYWNVDI